MCKYGECKYCVNGKCTKENEIAKLSTEEIIKALIVNDCSLREK